MDLEDNSLLLREDEARIVLRDLIEGHRATLSSLAGLILGAVQSSVDSKTSSGGCSGQIAISNPGLKVFTLETLLYQPTADLSGPSLQLYSGTLQSSVGENNRLSLVRNAWVFAMGQGSARGTVVCAGGYVQANLQLKAGWNALTLSFDSVNLYSGTRYLSTDPKPATFAPAQFPM